jgi:hypothetical protein
LVAVLLFSTFAAADATFVPVLPLLAMESSPVRCGRLHGAVCPDPVSIRAHSDEIRGFRERVCRGNTSILL